MANCHVGQGEIVRKWQPETAPYYGITYNVAAFSVPETYTPFLVGLIYALLYVDVKLNSTCSKFEGPEKRFKYESLLDLPLRPLF